MGLIGRAAARTRTFTERKKGLEKKAWELSVLCNIDVAVVCAGPGGGRAPDVWEFGSAGVIDRYRRLPADKRAKHTYLGYLNVELGKEKAKLAKERQGGPKALAPPGAASLKGMNLEELLGSIDAELLATAERRKALGVPDDVGGGHAPDAAAVASIGQGAALLVGDDGGFDDMEAWVEELTWHGVEPPNPLDASMMQPASGAIQYTNGVEPHQPNASMMPPASGAQYIHGGNPYLMQRMGGNGENAGHGQLAWDASHSTVSSYPDYGFQYTDSNCSDMAMCPQMPVPSNADGRWSNQVMWVADKSSCDAVVPVEYYHHPSLDFAGNPVYMPPEHSGMGAGDCFTGVPGIGLDDSFMDASGYDYGTQCLAGYFQCPDPSQEFSGVEPLHYFSDVAEGIALSHCSSGTQQFSSQQSQSDVQDQGFRSAAILDDGKGSRIQLSSPSHIRDIMIEDSSNFG